MKSASRILGWCLVAGGAVSVFVGISPLFEVRFEAYALGIGLFGAGAWVLAGKDLRDTIRRGLQVARQSRLSARGSTGSARRADGAAALADRLLPVKILKLAQQHGGMLTVARVAMELNVPLDQAQAVLDECVRAGNALPDYDIVHGHALYRFPEFTDNGPTRLPE